MCARQSGDMEAAKRLAEGIVSRATVARETVKGFAPEGDCEEHNPEDYLHGIEKRGNDAAADDALVRKSPLRKAGYLLAFVIDY